MNNELKGSLLLLIAAIIWGSTFVSQSLGMEHIGPFTFNMLRSIVGFLSLIPVTYLFRKRVVYEHHLTPEKEALLNKNSVIAGFFCGLFLSAASLLQQMGISMTTAGKAGFITALYIIIVPFIGIFLKKKLPLRIWICALIALSGFYLLSVNGDLGISEGDLYCLLCALFFSLQIISIDFFTKKKETDAVMMSMVQFFVASLVSALFALPLESFSLSSLYAALPSILYAGVLSSGAAYTLQILGQKYVSGGTAPLIMSLESVFAALSGWLILNEHMSVKELLGCALVFAAVIISQL